MSRHLRVPIGMALGLLVVLAAAAAFSSPEVSFRSTERDGERVAEVLMGERPVIVLRTSAADYHPLERAEIIANRLRTALAEEVGPDDVRVASVAGGDGLYIRDYLIVAVYEPEAEAHAATTDALARLWRDNVLLALDHEPPHEVPAPDASSGEEPDAESTGEAAAAEGAEEAAGTEAESDTVDWTGTAQKWVPVLSLEREGLRLGMAQVAGPPVQVERVKGVYQLRLNFRDIGRVYAYIPVGTLSVTKLDRVQGVSVWALADIQVLGF
jgi:hypothetical protein